MQPNKSSFGEARNEKVSSGWGKWAELRGDREFMEQVAWAEYPLVRRYINSKVSGDEEVDWLEWAAKTCFPKPVKLGLSLGCGSGYLERRILDMGIARRMEGIDLSKEALDLAQKAAQDKPITYRRLDLNYDLLEPERYDFAVSAALLHHITNLEHCLAQVHRSLKKRGLLIMYEFVGPDRFQWTDKQLELINRAYSLLPERYTYNHLTGMVHSEIERRPLHYMIEADPSEAVRSSEILEILSWFFEIVELRMVGGTLLHPLLEGIAGNFDEASHVDRALLGVLMDLEEVQIEEGCLPSDFVVLIGRRRKEKLSQEEAMRVGREKATIITRQEEEILGLNRRLAEAEVQNQKLRKIADEHLAELEKLRRERLGLVEENTVLKSKGLLGTLRFFWGKSRKSEGR